jgi:predicted nucleic acid-binding protein
MTTALDTNAVLDAVNVDSRDRDGAIEAIADLAPRSTLVISEVVYAELAAGYGSQERLDAMLDDIGIQVTPLGRDAAFTAGMIFAAYRRSGGPRRHIMADFLIAAHAAHHAGQLLTRDRGFYREYFPDLKLMEP